MEKQTRFELLNPKGNVLAEDLFDDLGDAEAGVDSIIGDPMNELFLGENIPEDWRDKGYAVRVAEDQEDVI